MSASTDIARAQKVWWVRHAALGLARGLVHHLDDSASGCSELFVRPARHPCEQAELGLPTHSQGEL